MAEENCTHNCETCTAHCDSRESLRAEPNPNSRVRKMIGVVSGKGGVGKSLVTGMMAVLARRAGYYTAVFDADITGPSVPKMFNVVRPVTNDEQNLFPAETGTGIKLMSINLLLENETDPVVWRGPVIAGTVKQFWTDVAWGDVDFMFVDMPPGTGDVPLTVYQSLSLDGIIVVTSPQELVGMIVEKAVNMTGMLKIPVLGIVENMSYVECPDCGKKIEVYGPSRLDETAEHFGITGKAKLPIKPELAAACDKGRLEGFEGDWLNDLFSSLEDD